MKKIAFALFATALLSTAAVAADKRTADVTEVSPWMTMSTFGGTAAFEASGDSTLTAYDRQIMNSIANDQGDYE